MAKPLEEIVGKFERERVITGTRPNERENDTVRYVSFEKGEDPGEIFGEVVSKVQPPLVNSGGVMLDGGCLTLPDGTRLYPLVLNGDLDAWRSQIEQGASELGLLTGRIVGDDFIISDGRSYPLSACSVVFELEPDEIRRVRAGLHSIGLQIYCGTFEGRRRSGSALDGVLHALDDAPAGLIEEIQAAFGNKEYVLISEKQAALLLPLLVAYRRRLIADIGHKDWFAEAVAESAAGLDPKEAKSGKGRGWRLFCVTDLVRACETSLAEHQEVAIVVS